MADIISLLSALQPFVWPISLVVIVYKFHGSIGELIKKAVDLTFRHRETEVSVKTHQSNQSVGGELTNTPQLPEETGEGQKEILSTSETELASVSKEGDDSSTLSKLTTALDKRDFKEAEAMFKAWQSETEDIRQKQGHEAYYYSQLYICR